MGMAVGSAGRGTLSEMNVVPLIDILLVLLIIFMLLAQQAEGLEAQLPQPAVPGKENPRPEPVVVEVLDSGALRINRQAVSWEDLGPRLAEIFKQRAEKVAFVRGDAPVEFSQVARAIDVMHGAGVDSVALLTPGIASAVH